MAKTSRPRAKRKAACIPEPDTSPVENVPSRWPNVERATDPDAPYFGLSKEEFERLAFWRRHRFTPDMERAMDWLMLNLDRIRAETIEYEDGTQRTKIIEYDDTPLRAKTVEDDGKPL